MLFNCPLSSSKADLLVDVLELAPNSRVMDAGCGTGEFLIRVVSRFNAFGTGVDINAESLALARSAASRRVSGRAVFEERTITGYPREEAFDCGICMAATHAYARGEPAYPEALRGLSRLVKPGGKLLVGESYWTTEPPREYRDFIGEPIGTYRSHFENVELAKEMGLIPFYVTTSSLDEWDDFEWRHSIQQEKKAATFDDDKADELLKSSREWRTAYLRWGRGTMGFGYYVFLNGG